MKEDVIARLEERVEALEALARQRPIVSDYLYTPSEVAEWLRCGKTNVYDLMSSGALATTRIGAGSGGLRVRGSDVTSFLDSRKEGGPSPRMAFKHLKNVAG